MSVKIKVTKSTLAAAERAERVFACIYVNQPISCGAISIITDINQVTVSKYLRDLKLWVSYESNEKGKRFYSVRDDETSKKMAVNALIKHGKEEV